MVGLTCTVTDNKSSVCRIQQAFSVACNSGFSVLSDNLFIVIKDENSIFELIMINLFALLSLSGFVGCGRCLKQPENLIVEN